MKDFRKNKNGLFICEECGKLFKLKGSLARHIKKDHREISQKIYFDKWIKSNDDGKCVICENETNFIDFSKYYQKTCCDKCNYKLRSINMASDERRKKIKKTCLFKYGVDNVLKSSLIKSKINESNIKKYGVKNPYQREDVKDKIKQTKYERYGNEKYQNWEKQRQTCVERYGTEYVLSKNEIREKGKKTLLKKIGVEHQSQNDEIHKRQMQSGKKTNQFNDNLSIV